MMLLLQSNIFYLCVHWGLSMSTMDSENQPQNDFQSMWSMPHNENDSTIQPSINDMMWTKKKPSEMDNEATHLMLSLREEKSTYFDDKRTRKLKLWNDIAKELEENNFHLGNKGGKRCRQKFANLQKTYLSYMKHQTTTGSERIDDIPPFCDELHSILGCKHKVTPLNLEDSMDETSESVKNEIEQQQPDHTDSEETQLGPSTTTPVSRLKKTRKVTPSRHDDRIREMETDRKIRSEEFSFLKEHLMKTEQQKDRFLEIVEAAFGTKKEERVIQTILTLTRIIID
ncbi:unnamed protein product [Acanthoscelides obtectus]|uniref:Myb/SANT-like DNA-binding domain-containing protein n=1 Tax=Acanthoscelides obtectus TaxID=200917 RepID=A0A9P0LE94_ACAOB|nr:unnamed protein product [Acanthoscelides obtectus]CAK1624381.1 hypothetical protein AOBTE_LOCUS2532 [Acanthoscelides obtectus]